MRSADANAPTRALTVRLAHGAADIEAAQRLRWAVFHSERGARPTSATRLDVDPYDAACDHLLVEDTASGTPAVVGTYRLLRQRVAMARSGFYSADEFDLTPLGHDDGERLELGRSCVAPAYRDAGTIQLLWRGIAAYLERHAITLMFGCASFHGTDPADHADTLSYLWHNYLAPSGLRARARYAPDRDGATAARRL